MKYAARVHTVYTWNICTIWVLGTGLVVLTHWGRVTHICVSKLTIIGSDNGLSPDRRQAIIWTNAGLLLIGPLGTNFSEIWIEILTFSFKKMRLKVSSAKRRPFCLGFNVSTDFCGFVRFIHPHSPRLLKWHLENYMIIARASDTRVTLYTAGHLHTAVPHCSHSRAPIVHTAVARENNEHGCVYLRCRAVCKLPGCVEGHPWI